MMKGSVAEVLSSLFWWVLVDVIDAMSIVDTSRYRLPSRAPRLGKAAYCFFMMVSSG